MNRLSRRAVAALAACAIGFAATCPAAGLDACRLISPARAGRILGTTITLHPVDTSAAGEDAGSMCRYAGKKPGSGFTLIAARIRYGDAADEVARQQNAARANLPPGFPKPSFSNISGLGEAAYLSISSGYFQLHVLSGGNSIVINRNADANAKSVAQARQIAQAVLERIK